MEKINIFFSACMDSLRWPWADGLRYRRALAHRNDHFLSIYHDHLGLPAGVTNAGAICWDGVSHPSLPIQSQMTASHSTIEDGELVLAFAQDAGHNGWHTTAFRRFCFTRGISAEEMHARWPAGVRSLGWDLNHYADNVMCARFDKTGPAPLSKIILDRFADHAPIKQAVRRLALSDALHPVDTLVRTARTAKAMWRLQDRPMPRSVLARQLKIWSLVVLYSACVLVWLADGSISQRPLRKAIHLSVKILGAH